MAPAGGLVESDACGGGYDDTITAPGGFSAYQLVVYGGHVQTGGAVAATSVYQYGGAIDVGGPADVGTLDEVGGSFSASGAATVGAVGLPAMTDYPPGSVTLSGGGTVQTANVAAVTRSTGMARSAQRTAYG